MRTAVPVSAKSPAPITKLSAQSTFPSPSVAAVPGFDATLQPKYVAVAMFDYRASNVEEISIVEHDRLSVLDDSDPDWTVVQLESDPAVRGIVPASYIGPVADKGISFGAQRSSSNAISTLSAPVITGYAAISVSSMTSFIETAPVLPRRESSALEPPATYQSPVEALPSRENPNADTAPVKTSPDVQPPALPSRDTVDEEVSPIKPNPVSPLTVPAGKTISALGINTLPESRLVAKDDEGTEFDNAPPLPARDGTSPVTTMSIDAHLASAQPSAAVKVETEAPSLPSRSLPTEQPTFTIPLKPVKRTPSSVVAPFNNLRETPKPGTLNVDSSNHPAGVAPPLPSPRRASEASPGMPRRGDDIKLRHCLSLPVKSGYAQRLWTDRSGSFKVDARLLGVHDGKVQLHKINGVKIAVPLEKLSKQDVEHLVDLKLVSVSTLSAFDLPMVKEAPRQSLVAHQGSQSQKAVTEMSSEDRALSYNGHNWFSFFTTAGITSDDARAYAKKFVEEKMDATTLPHLDRDLLKEMGIAAGDILKIQAKKNGPTSLTTGAWTSFTSAVSPVPERTYVVPQTQRKSDPRVNMLEMEAATRNLALLQGLSAGAGSTGTSIIANEDADAKLAAALQEEEMRRAGVWKEQPSGSGRPAVKRQDRQAVSVEVPAGSSRMNSAAANVPNRKNSAAAHVEHRIPSTAEHVEHRISTPSQVPHRQVQAPNTVDVSTVFNAAKTLANTTQQGSAQGQMMPSSTVQKPPRNRQQQMLVNQQPHQQAQPKPSTAALQAPLIPTPSSVVPLPVTVSNGDVSLVNQQPPHGFMMPTPPMGFPAMHQPSVMAIPPMRPMPMGMPAMIQPQMSMQMAPAMNQAQPGADPYGALRGLQAMPTGASVFPPTGVQVTPMQFQQPQALPQQPPQQHFQRRQW